MKKKCSVAFLALAISISNALGQKDFREGFIINLQNDTIKGQVSYRTSAKKYESCVFISKGTETEFSPKQIQGYGFPDDKFYSSEVVENTFVEVLVVGQLSLYKSEDEFYVQKDTPIYELESIIEEVQIDGKIGKKERGKWRGILSYLTGDCFDKSNNNVSRLKFEERSLTDFTIKYNKCKGTEYTELKSTKSWTDVDLGISAGITISTIKHTDPSGMFFYLGDDSYHSTNPYFGAVISISSPRISDKFVFQGEINFHKSNYSFERYSGGGANPIFYEASIDIKTISFPLSIMHLFPMGSYEFYLQGGVNIDYLFDAETLLLREQQVGNETIQLSPSSFWDIQSFLFGYMAGIGVQKSLEAIRISLAARYFQSLNPMYRDPNPFFEAKSNRISFSLFVFKK